MRKKTLGILALGMALMSPLVHAQTMTLTLEEALKKGKESSRQLKIADSKVTQAKEMVEEAASNRLPTLKFQGGYSRLSDVPVFSFQLPFGNNQEVTIAPVILNNYQLKLSVQQPIYTGNRIESMVDAARYSAQAAEIDKNRDSYDVSYAIKNSYWTLYRAVEFKKVVEESIEMLKARIKDAEVLEKNGLLTRNDIPDEVLILMYTVLVENIVRPEVLAKAPLSPSQMYQALVKVFFEGVMTTVGRMEWSHKGQHLFRQIGGPPLALSMPHQ